MTSPLSAVALFPPPPSLSFANDSKLQGAVDAALKELTDAVTDANKIADTRAQTAADAAAHAPNAAARRTLEAEAHKAKAVLANKYKIPVPFSLAIIDLGDGSASGTLKWGAYKPGEMHFIASGAKMAAMYAAFALRDMVQRLWSAARLVQGLSAVAGALGAKLDPVPASLLKGLQDLMNPAILKASPKLLSSLSQDERLPSYADVFVSPGKGWGSIPDFTGAFQSSMQLMIVPSDNDAAGRCIRGVGYGYLNAALAAAGLFSDKTDAKVWLAGDYVGLYHYGYITSTNDAAVAQAGTALGMAQLMAMIMNRAIFLDGGAYTTMHTLLHDATNGVDVPFLTRKSVDSRYRIPLAKLTHAKLGRGPLKSKHYVVSETFRIEGVGKPGKSYAVAFQNVDSQAGVSLDEVALMLRRAIEIYEA